MKEKTKKSHGGAGRGQGRKKSLLETKIMRVPVAFESHVKEFVSDLKTESEKTSIAKASEKADIALWRMVKETIGENASDEYYNVVKFLDYCNDFNMRLCKWNKKEEIDGIKIPAGYQPVKDSLEGLVKTAFDLFEKSNGKQENKNMIELTDDEQKILDDELLKVDKSNKKQDKVKKETEQKLDRDNPEFKMVKYPLYSDKKDVEKSNKKQAVKKVKAGPKKSTAKDEKSNKKQAAKKVKADPKKSTAKVEKSNKKQAVKKVKADPKKKTAKVEKSNKKQAVKKVKADPKKKTAKVEKSNKKQANKK